MATGKSDYSNNSGYKLYYLNIKGLKKGEEVYIECKDKDTGHTEACDYVEGKLTKISFIEKEYEGREYKEIKFNIIDGKDLFLLSMRYTNLSRGILSQLLNIPDWSNPWIKIEVKMDKENKFANAWVSGPDKKWVGFKYKRENYKDLIYEMKNANGEVEKRDYTKVEEFLEEEIITKIIPLLVKEKRIQESTSENIERVQEKHDDEFRSTEDDSPLPF